ncbi:hypothetical protein C6P88_16750 [Burkholderia contaminans]|nr:hypothetical protein C6P88_16750 [Burkholderia contaminans]
MKLIFNELRGSSRLTSFSVEGRHIDAPICDSMERLDRHCLDDAQIARRQLDLSRLAPRFGISQHHLEIGMSSDVSSEDCYDFIFCRVGHHILLYAPWG